MGRDNKQSCTRIKTRNTDINNKIKGIDDGRVAEMGHGQELYPDEGERRTEGEQGNTGL